MHSNYNMEQSDINNILKPIKFEPHYKTVMWGGEKISQFKGIPLDCKTIGESWEISGVKGSESIVSNGVDKGLTVTQMVEKYRSLLVGGLSYEKFGTTFPILVKIIDAKKDLSFQVHPSDELAEERHNCMGKTEMWYIVDTDKDAKLYAGLSQETTPQEYEQRIEDGSIMDIVNCYNTSPGDLYFLPSGCTHSIGAGNLLVEIQQTSDITYRVYDYKRQDTNGKYRELHTDLARAAIDYSKFCSKMDYCNIDKGRTKLINCKHFTTSLIKTDDEINLKNEHDSFLIIICVSGEAVVEGEKGSETIRQGETVLIPAALKEITIKGKATLLTASAGK